MNSESSSAPNAAPKEERAGIAAPPAPPEAVKAEGTSVFSYGSFLKLFFGSLSGAFADRVYFAALFAAVNVIFISAPENEQGFIQIVASVPLLLLYGLSGSLVDSVDRRRLLFLVKAIKAAAVLLFVPILFQAVHIGDPKTDAALIEMLKGRWPLCLGLVVLLNILTVPFGPARAAAIPDVLPEKHREMGASLMATSGLMALMAAQFVGGMLARTNVLGPALTMAVSALFYVVSAMLFLRLPDAVAVPGTRREGAAAAGEAGKPQDSFIKGFIDGLKYCLSRVSVVGLIFFETIFWCVASAINILIGFHARTEFQLTGNNLTTFQSWAYPAAGVGLFAGALGVGKICRKVSPIVTYTPGFVLLAGGIYLLFRAQGLPGGGAPTYVYPVMFAIGLGGGSILGRVDADVLGIADESMRGRVFSIKAMAFAAVNLLVTWLLSSAGLTDDQKHDIALWMPRIFLLLLPLAVIFAWFVDIAIWAKRGDTELPGPVHRAGYALLRFTSRTLFQILFRYEVIGAENIPASGPVVLCANHASFIDPLLLGCSTKRIVQYIMYSSYYRSLAHPIFRFLRCIPVDEKGGTAALKAGMRSLKQGACVGIFPEGRVSADGQLQPPQGGVLFLAQRSGAPVVAVALKGNFAAFPRGAWFPRPKKITIIYGKPFTVGKDISRDEMAAITDKMMADLAEKLELPPPPKAEKGKEKDKEKGQDA
jgi:1-acyl-sn-glycerol-3-phosphate acyltransferase